MSELLPCPFCGSTDLDAPAPRAHCYVSCLTCEADGPINSEDPVAAWNRRAVLPREGWKLAPLSPTEEQIEAGKKAEAAGCCMADVYHDMVLAAPPTQEEQE